MEDSIRFADQSKALWMQHNSNNNNNNNNNMNSISSNEFLNQKHNNRNSSGCVGRCPFASIMATIITVCGTGVFSGCLYRALSITIQMLSTAFKIENEIEWVRIVQTIVIINFITCCAYYCLFNFNETMRIQTNTNKYTFTK